MGLGTGGAAIAGASGLSSIFGGIFGNKAANAQANAAKGALNLGQQALDFQKSTSALNRNDMYPWIGTGTNAIMTLGRLLGIGGNLPGAPSQPGSGPNSANWALSPQQRIAAAQSGAPVSWMNGQPAVGQAPGVAANGMPLGMLGGYQGTDVNAPNAGFANNAMAPGGVGPGGQANNSMGGGGLNPSGNAFLTQPGGTPLSGLSGYDPLDPTGQLGPDGSLAMGWNEQFQAPTDVTEQNDPGYQFRLQQGQKALENSAAARGGLLSGGTGKALQQFGQDYASNEYGNVYNRALGQFQQRYNIFQNNQANLFNRLSALAGGGQVAASNLASGQLQSANQIGNTYANMGQDLMNYGAARGSGYAATGNAIGGALNNVSQYAMLSQLLGGL